MTGSDGWNPLIQDLIWGMDPLGHGDTIAPKGWQQDNVPQRSVVIHVLPPVLPQEMVRTTRTYCGDVML